MTTDLKPIRTKADYEVARDAVERLWGAKSGRVADILNRKRGLSIEMIRQLHERLGISAEVLTLPSRFDRVA